MRLYQVTHLQYLPRISLFIYGRYPLVCRRVYSVSASSLVLSIRGIEKQVCVNISSRFIPNIYNEEHQALCCNCIVFHSNYYCESHIPIQRFLQSYLPWPLISDIGRKSIMCTKSYYTSMRRIKTPLHKNIISLPLHWHDDFSLMGVCHRKATNYIIFAK